MISQFISVVKRRLNCSGHYFGELDSLIDTLFFCYRITIFGNKFHIEMLFVHLMLQLVKVSRFK